MYSRICGLQENSDQSQNQLAQRLEMPQTGYSKYETGENDIPTAILLQLAEAYAAGIDYILGLTDEKRPYPRRKRR